MLFSVFAGAQLLWRATNQLNSSDIAWTISSPRIKQTIPATVPGVVHLDLLGAGLLQGDPLYRYNELNWSWVAEADWNYTGVFALDAASQLLGGAAHLQFEGLDTVASVSVNGHHVGDANDAFVRWSFVVPSGLLRAGTNTIGVALTAAKRYAAAQAASYPYPVPASICEWLSSNRPSRLGDPALALSGRLSYLVRELYGRLEHQRLSQCLHRFPKKFRAQGPFGFWLGLGAQLHPERHHRQRHPRAELQAATSSWRWNPPGAPPQRLGDP